MSNSVWSMPPPVIPLSPPNDISGSRKEAWQICFTLHFWSNSLSHVFFLLRGDVFSKRNLCALFLNSPQAGPLWPTGETQLVFLQVTGERDNFFLSQQSWMAQGGFQSTFSSTCSFKSLKDFYFARLALVELSWSKKVKEKKRLQMF